MTTTTANGPGRGFSIRRARLEDLDQARALMLRTFDEDFGYGYRPDYHADVDDLRGVYLDNPRHVLFVAVDDASGEIIGTAGIRSGGLKEGFNPRWLVDRYDAERTAQIVRVYIAREHRRRGIAQELVEAARQFVAEDGTYTRIALHTDPLSPGAERFWKAQATTLIHDDRDGPSGSIHFEMDIPSERSSSAAP